ncbi:hypothetical protein DPEC_G00183450 [Dallia pectoralis]|uniref:Uncharacterized protein n=1 Tax=Dallia pectoralis TaxID=75939 RepID=A0ACC2GAS8_DALPE|nr:hypothetical protein DPEC_G00183450 [Dallia pectoralis]
MLTRTSHMLSQSQTHSANQSHSCCGARRS